MVQIKLLTREELNNSLELVWQVFQKYEAVNYPESGKNAFYEAIHSEEYLKQLAAYGAFIDDKLVGIIATRNSGSHIALFFVDGEYHRQGIGRKLWEAVLAKNTSEVITVNSSLYAEEVYKSLGFTAKADLQEEDGIKYVPMEYLHLLDMLQDEDDNKAYAKTGGIDMKEFIAYCGLDCETCEARLATINNDDALREKVAKDWGEMNQMEFKKEWINCEGCRIDGIKTMFCDSICEIRQCALAKGFKTCKDCSEKIDCEKLKMITGHSEDAKDNLE